MSPVPPGEQPALFNFNDDPDTIEILDRLEIIKNEEGFLATSRGELNEAFNVRTFGIGGAAKHLAEISQHQVTHGADPQTATSSVTREYGGYGERARADLTSLLTLSEELEDQASANPLATVDATRLLTGTGQYVRYVDLSKLATTKDVVQFSFNPLRGYTKLKRDAYDPYISTQPAPEVQAHIQAILGSTRQWEMRQVLAAAVEDQRHRLGFWKDRVSEIEKHQTGVTRGVAQTVLHRMGVQPDHTESIEKGLQRRSDGRGHNQ